MKTLITNLLLFGSFCASAQTTFQIQEPVSLAGAYAFRLPTAADWGGPDPSQPGNWFSDTVQVANDGTPAEACDPLITPLSGQFAIARRTGCPMGTLLLNLQNAGATGALIIDTVDGRPLAFSPDSLSLEITIPFTLISRGQGDSILARIANNETVVVGFGNKSGIHTNDLGIYTERCLWHRYATDDSPGNMTDTGFGAWVFNPGTAGQTGAVLSFVISNTSDTITNLSSDPFDLASGDSLFIPFTLSSVNTLPQGYYNARYRLSGTTDEDTLNNITGTTIRTYSNQVSTVLDYAAGSIVTADYLLPGSSIEVGDSTAFFIFKQPENGFSPYFCTVRFKIRIADSLLPAYLEMGFNFYHIENSDGEPVLGSDLSEDFFGEVITTSESDIFVHASTPPDGSMYYGLSLLNLTSTPFELLFSSDYYPDERMVREPGLASFYYMHRNNVPVPYFSSVPTELTPIIQWQLISGCVSGLDDLSLTPFVLFPNPATDQLSIETETDWTSFAVYDLMGSVCLQFYPGSDAFFVGDFPGGMYQAVLTDTSGQKYQRLFVKN